LRTGAKFLGVLYAATEYDYVKHGKHISTMELAYKQLVPTLKSSKKSMDLEKVVLVNGHGGNFPLISYLNDVEKKTGLEIIFNNKIVEIEGPHAGSGELSIGKILGMTDESQLDEHCNFQKYPEVGMVGLNKARKLNKGINEGACLIESQGIFIDVEKGYDLLETALKNIVEDIRNLLIVD
ncbi:MAG: 2-amino-5-formylamino-6-ribosylaminopyrimidin-4(3H)-one 5'-monophosphate deformylase, partial [Methanobacteriaceae archaeon]|nr:2-amino-5-formylamino-6-ribosylaminopyrimidin-4(3H)-one 5'-monophosphate deformylase [Methanobacteriaceae archaeon]